MKTKFMTGSIALLILVILSPFVLIFFYNQSLSSKDPHDSTPKLFVIRQGASVAQIAHNLEREGLIRSALAFRLLVSQMGIQRNIQAGDFKLSPVMSARDIAQELTRGALDLWVTIPEGWRKEEIAQRMAQIYGISESEFIQKSDEGYLFPDTYLIPRKATVEQILAILKTNFDKKFDEDLKARADQLSYFAKEVLTLASIVEREARNQEQREIIAGILIRRWQDRYLLEADATVQYVLGYQADQRTWWKRNLVEKDKQVKSDYNTYQKIGLPPGPIANPGLGAIKAVLYPAKTDFYFYLHDREGNAHFAKTFSEHQKNIRDYL